MNRLCCFLLIFITVAHVSGTKYTDCGSQTGQVFSVQVSDCPDTAAACDLHRGTSANINIKFQAKTETQSVKAVVHGIIAGVPMPFPLPQADGCKSGITCPTTNGQTYTYGNAIKVRNSYPPLSLTVKWQLKDENSKDIVCVEIPCDIK